MLLWPDGDIMQLSLMQKFILKVVFETFIILTAVLCLFFFGFAADISTDPADAGDSSAPAAQSSSVENSSDADDSSPAPSVDNSTSSEEPGPAYDGDVSVHYSEEPSSYEETQDVVVNRADLQDIVDLLNDLSVQLGLYASEVPAGYQPTEDDLAYRADLLDTLAGIHDSLLALTEPPVEDSSVPEDSSTPTEETAPSEASSAPPVRSAPAETDPADSSGDESSPDCSTSGAEDTNITEQDFYKLVLGMLFLVVLYPVLTWIYRFLSSFIPV